MFLAINDYLKLPRLEHPWLIDKLVPAGGMVNLYGKPKSHKSFLSFGLAYAISQGLPDWEGFKVLKHGPVAYLQVDTPREIWLERISKLEYTHRDNLFMSDMWLTPEFPFNILNPMRTELKWLKQEMDRLKPVMVVFDTLRDIHSGDENDNTVMRNVLVELVAACRPAAIMLVSHSKKTNEAFGEPDIMDEQRGASSVAGRMDMVIRLTKKRLQWEGRQGGGKVPIEHYPDGWIKVIRQSDENKEIELIHELKQRGLSNNAIAIRIADEFNVSVSTATRRIKDYEKQHDDEG